MVLPAIHGLMSWAEATGSIRPANAFRSWPACPPRTCRASRISGADVRSSIVALLVVFAILPTTLEDGNIVKPGHDPFVSFLVPDVAARGFLENVGQLDSTELSYIGEGPGFAVGFSAEGAFLRLTDRAPMDTRTPRFSDDPVGGPSTGVVVQMSFEGANVAPPRGRDELPYRTNFFIGSDPARWYTGVRSYREVVYRSLYEGVDLVYRRSDHGLKYDFLVHGDADPAIIRLAYDGVDEISLGPDGSIRIATSVSELRDAPPEAWRDGRSVPCSYTLPAPRVIGFRCTDWGGSGPLVIDPLVYSTFVGGSGPDQAWAITLDAAGNAYVTGETRSGDFPTTPGVFDPSANGGLEVFVAKLNATGTSLVYATYLGGSGSDRGHAIAVDAAGNAFVTGSAQSPDFPTTPGAFDRTCGSDGNCNRVGMIAYNDAFVAELGPSGDALLYATFLGGAVSEDASSVGLDAAGYAFVAGGTYSPDFPTTPGAMDRTCGSDGFCNFDGLNYLSDAFLAKVNPSGTSLVYSTFLGGSHRDNALSLTTDFTGSAYLTGTTNSTDFPTTPGAFQRDRGTDVWGEAFVAKVDPSGSALVYSTFLGGTAGHETGFNIVLDASGDAFLGGITYSSDFPTTPGAFDTSFNPGPLSEYDVFVAKLNSAGSNLLYSTFIGGSGQDTVGPGALRVNDAGEAYITGTTGSPSFPTTTGAYQRSKGGVNDAFLTKLSVDGVSLVYSTYFGGQAEDFGRALALDAADDVYIVGAADSLEFPTTPGAFDRNLSGSRDAFVLKFAPLPDASVLGVSTTPAPPVSVGSPATVDVSVTNVGDVDALSFSVLAFEDLDGDDIFDPGEEIGIENVASLSVFESVVVSYPWTAAVPGVHRLCAVADNWDLVREGNETNNLLCADVLAVVPPVTGPDYAPQDPQPASPLTVGLSLDVPFSARVENIGNGTANRTATLAFFNASTPGTPFAPFFVPPLDAGNRSSPFVATWRSPALPGTYAIVADVDYGDDLAEWDEGNNAYTWTVSVVAGPVTDLVVGTPSYAGAALHVTSATDLSFSVLDQSGTGIRRTMYRVDNGSWEDYAATGPFRLTVEGERFLEWSSEDLAGNVEPIRSAALRVDDTPPTTALAIGDPKYLVGGTYVTSATPLALAASDGGLTAVGVALSEYRVDNGPWTSYASSFSIAGDGPHVIAYRSLDFLGNLEPDESATILVDDTPPATALAVGDPKHVAAQTFVTSSTPLSLSAVDGGVNPVGIAFTEYRVDGGSWIPYTAPFALAAEGTHLVEYRSGDHLGNVETTLAATFVVDDAPPSAVLSIGTPRYEGADTYVTTATPLTVTATDGGPVPVGVASVEYRLTGSWTMYAGAFTLAGPDGPRTVGYRATDLLGNALAHELDVVLDNTAPTTTPSRGDGTYPAGTAFGFTATDAGSGVARTEVRVDGGAWTTYAVPLQLGEGDHEIGFRSVDNLNNAEAERTLSVRIEDVSQPAQDTNWKPLVAAVFASALALVGAWSARRAHLTSGDRRGFRAFALTALPFVLTEAGTGVVSHLTGLLAIPPLLGTGTVVDVGVLLAGIAVAVYPVRKGSPPR